MKTIRLFFLVVLFTFGTSLICASEYKRLQKRVKKHLKVVEKIYPLKKWAYKLKKGDRLLSDAKADFYRNPSQGVIDLGYQQLVKLKAQVNGFRQYIGPLNMLKTELTTMEIIKDAFPEGLRVRNAQQARARSKLRLELKQSEKERIAPKQEMLNNGKRILKEMESLEADWMFHYARNNIFESAKHAFKVYHFSENARALRIVAKKVRMYIETMGEQPDLAKKSLSGFEKKIDVPLKHLGQLKQALSPEMLYSNILSRAAHDHIDFTLGAEEKIEKILTPLSRQNTNAVLKQKEKWFALRQEIRTGLSQVDHARMAALRKKRRKKEMHAYLTVMESAQPESTVDIPEIPVKNILHDIAGEVRTSQVASARKKLHVEVAQFSDDMAHVDKKALKLDKQAAKDFGRIESGGKAAASLYTFVASNGRADHTDLERFVQEVGLLSFGGCTEFRSYLLPRKWRPGKNIKWQADKGEKVQENLNREFSYVDLVTEAHRPHYKVEAYQYVKNVYVPANMILIFESEGRIKRYQTFSDIRKLIIRQSDISSGHIYYKFLNYSAYGSEIHLNGIDHEIKLATAH